LPTAIEYTTESALAFPSNEKDLLDRKVIIPGANTIIATVTRPPTTITITNKDEFNLKAKPLLLHVIIDIIQPTIIAGISKGYKF
jgi:hypothetical protein